MKDFAIESERMEMTEEMMSDTIDDVMEGDEEVRWCRYFEATSMLAAITRRHQCWLMVVVAGGVTSCCLWRF